jgi:hypothetical protein
MGLTRKRGRNRSQFVMRAHSESSVPLVQWKITIYKSLNNTSCCVIEPIYETI